MTELSGGKKSHRARGTPAAVYLSSPPSITAGIEVVYHARKPDALKQFEKACGEQIVTKHVLYKPGILAIARTNFQGTRWNLHQERDITKVVPFPPKRQVCRWEENLNAAWSFHDSRTDPELSSLFVPDNAYDFSAEHFEELREDFLQHLVSTETMKIEYNPIFKLDRKFDESLESFANRCLEKAREDFNQEMRQLEDTLRRLEDRLKQKMDREVREIGTDSSQRDSTRRPGELHVQEEIEAHDSKTSMEEIRKEMTALDHLREEKMKEFEERVVTVANERETETFRMNRSQIRVLQFNLIWLPYTEYVIQENDFRRMEVVQAF